MNWNTWQASVYSAARLSCCKRLALGFYGGILSTITQWNYWRSKYNSFEHRLCSKLNLKNFISSQSHLFHYPFLQLYCGLFETWISLVMIFLKLFYPHFIFALTQTFDHIKLFTELALGNLIQLHFLFHQNFVLCERWNP